MIELDILTALREALETPCFMEMPENAPGAFVLIEKTGSGAENYLLRATFAVQSYGTSLFQAACLNEEAKAAMLRIPELVDNISRVELNSDYNFTDTETRRYRYQAVFDITYMEEMLWRRM